MLTRRLFLGSSGAALAVSSATQAQNSKKRLIVDVQVHLWKANSPDYPWNGEPKPHLPHLSEPFTVERALPMMVELGIDRAVIVPPGMSWSNAYALEVARQYPSRFAVMGLLQLND